MIVCQSLEGATTHSMMHSTRCTRLAPDSPMGHCADTTVIIVIIVVATSAANPVLLLQRRRRAAHAREDRSAWHDALACTACRVHQAESTRLSTIDAAHRRRASGSRTRDASASWLLCAVCASAGVAHSPICSLVLALASALPSLAQRERERETSAQWQTHTLSTTLSTSPLARRRSPRSVCQSTLNHDHRQNEDRSRSAAPPRSRRHHSAR